MAGRSPTYASLAEPLMEKAVQLFGDDDEHQRSYALNLIGLATVHLLKREPEQSTVLAEKALRVARKIRSERVNTRLRKTVDTAARDFGDIPDVAEPHRSPHRTAAGDRRSGLSSTPGPGHGDHPAQTDFGSPNCQVSGWSAWPVRVAVPVRESRNRTVCGPGRRTGPTPLPPPPVHGDVTHRTSSSPR